MRETIFTAIGILALRFRNLAVLLLISFAAMAGGWWIGHTGNEQEVIAAEAAMSQMQYSMSILGTYACLLDENTTVWQFIRFPEVSVMVRYKQLQSGCQALLESIGKNAPNDAISGELGEARLFLDGFNARSQKIMQRQWEIEKMYDGASEFNLEGLHKAKGLEQEQMDDLKQLVKMKMTIEQKLAGAGLLNKQ